MIIPCAGMLYIYFDYINIPGFMDYLSRQTPANHSANPWLAKVWQTATNGCSWNTSSTNNG